MTVLDLTPGPPLIMGVLNVTPDSFSDGGRFLDTDRAVRHACEMCDAGAAVIDIGGESTRPGSDAVDPDEQIRRTLPVIERLRSLRPQAVVSIDTQSAVAARAAIDAGAGLVNDVSALRGDPDMAALIARTGVHVALMHMHGTPRTMQQHPHYDDVVAEVADFLEARREFAVSCGIAGDRILVDPGIGFGKSVEHNLTLLAELERLTRIGPVLLGTSRKSFIGRVLDIADPLERGPGTEATHVLGLLAGVRMLRVHDVPAARQTLGMVRAIQSRRT